MTFSVIDVGSDPWGEFMFMGGKDTIRFGYLYQMGRNVAEFNEPSATRAYRRVDRATTESRPRRWAHSCR